jgi:Mn-dependent DtxR family transcriptional regulator
VNQTLDRLRRDGLIEYDRDHMTIVNEDRLRAVAEEE